MQLQVNVDETDVGLVRNGQKATFTVGAYPNRRYPATVTRVAYGSTKTDNVVTYTTLLDVDNQRPDAAPRHDRDGHDPDQRPRSRRCWCPTPRCASRRRGGRAAAAAPAPSERHQHRLAADAAPAGQRGAPQRGAAGGGTAPAAAGSSGCCATASRWRCR